MSCPGRTSRWRFLRMGRMLVWLGSMSALEVIREIVGFGEGLVGRLLMVDARAMRFETLRYGRDPANPLNGDKPTIVDLSACRPSLEGTG